MGFYQINKLLCIKGNNYHNEETTYRRGRRGWDVAQVVKCLPGRLKILSSNPSTVKKNKVEKKRHNGKKIFARYSSDKGLISRIYFKSSEN
jgi:hypothetical protein